MKSSAPWSVKGIERDARETAKEAAKREGMTVGEWLNQMIYSAGEAEPSGGEVEGLKLRDIVTAIEHLHKRIAEGQADSAGAVSEITRKIGDVVERVQRLERVKPAEGAPRDLAERIERLEQRGDERERIDALKALEKAVAQVAVQFNNAQKASGQRLDAVERQLQQFAERIDSLGQGSDDAGAGYLKNTIDGLSARIARTERIAGEAARLRNEAGGSSDPDFVESTGNRLRVLGDEIKRGGDQIRALEATIAKLASQIDAAERRSAEAVQNVAETLVEMREKFAADAAGEPSRSEIDAAVAEATRDTEQRVSALQRSFDAMIVRLEALDAEAGAPGRALKGAADTEDEEPSVAEGLAALSGGDEEIEGRLPAGEFEEPAIEEAETEARAADETNAESNEEEDPFAFADEIEAELDEAEDSSASDDVTFELDDGAEAAAATKEPSNDEARQLLSEVKAAFEQRRPTGDASEDDDEDGEAESSDDDLNALLADLDDLTNEAPPAGAPERRDEPDQEENDQDTPAKADGEESPKAQERKDDFLKAARRHAIESAERAAQKNQPLRRALTPKQRAILAARARQKRLAEEAGERGPRDPQRLHAAKAALRDAGDADANSGEEEKGPLARAAASVRDKLPLIGKKPETENAAEASNAEDDRAALRTLKAAIAARPVTLALTVGIFLSIAALFYLIKDLVFAPDAREAARPSASTIAQPTTQPPAEDAIQAHEPPAAETASAPAIDPRDLYLRAMAGLNAAGGEAEAAEAVETLREAAALGHPPAQLQLGELYKLGQGVDQDLGQARTWFRRAANGGNILAMHRIGVMTARGDGGPADTSEAIAWFERAANHGLVDSQYNLGAIYHPTDDPGPVQDVGKAYYWYSLAAKNGDEQAGPLADSVAPGLSADQRRDLDQAIADWEALPADEAANELAPASE